LNDLFVENVVMPNIGWFGWLIWLAEAFIAFSLFLGIFSRLGALVAQGVSTQLMLGLAPGRVLGLDALLPRPRLTAAADRGGRPAKLLVAFT
jgi:hypothetical protein